MIEDAHPEGDCYRCKRFFGPLHLWVLYLDPNSSQNEPRVVVCADCLDNEANVIRVSPFAFRVAPPRDLTRED